MILTHAEGWHLAQMEQRKHFWERRHAEVKNLVAKCADLYEKMEAAHEGELFVSQPPLTPTRIRVMVKALKHTPDTDLGRAYRQWRRAEDLERLIKKRSQEWTDYYWRFLKTHA